MSSEPLPQVPRSAQQRKHDILQRLEREEDVWVSSADESGNAFIAPLSFVWDGTALTMAAPETNLTARNVRAAGQVRMSLPATRDVVLIHGLVDAFTDETIPVEVADRFAARLGWDPRKIDGVAYFYLRVTPRRIQAWRSLEEAPGRTVLRDGRWVV